MSFDAWASEYVMKMRTKWPKLGYTKWIEMLCTSLKKEGESFHQQCLKLARSSRRTLAKTNSCAYIIIIARQLTWTRKRTRAQHQIRIEVASQTQVRRLSAALDRCMFSANLDCMALTDSMGSGTGNGAPKTLIFQSINYKKRAWINEPSAGL